MKIVLFLVLAGCCMAEAKSMAEHFRPQTCASDPCTTLTQRKWVGLGAGCETCGNGLSTLCYDGYCDTSDTKKCITTTCTTVVAAGGACDNKKCCGTGTYCSSVDSKCASFVALGQKCNGTAWCTPVSSWCNATTNGYCTAPKALGETCSGAYEAECVNSDKDGYGCIAGKCRQSVAAGATCNVDKNVCGSSIPCVAATACALNGKSGACADGGDCQSGICRGGKCNEVLNVGATCGGVDQACKGYSECSGTKCTLYRSVAENGLTTDVKFCQYGLFLDGGKCVKVKVCASDDECGAYPEDSNIAGDIVVCNPDDSTKGCTGAGNKGKCATLAPKCADVANAFWAENNPGSANTLKGYCCIDTAINAETTETKNLCKATPTSAPKSGASASYLTMSAILVALVAGFFAI